MWRSVGFLLWCTLVPSALSGAEATGPSSGLVDDYLDPGSAAGTVRVYRETETGRTLRVLEQRLSSGEVLVTQESPTSDPRLLAVHTKPRGVPIVYFLVPDNAEWAASPSTLDLSVEAPLVEPTQGGFDRLGAALAGSPTLVETRATIDGKWLFVDQTSPEGEVHLEYCKAVGLVRFAVHRPGRATLRFEVVEVGGGK